eukprot:12002212-Heterocapsa_arctica.AAC.1
MGKHTNPDKVSNTSVTNRTKDHVKAHIKAHMFGISEPEKSTEATYSLLTSPGRAKQGRISEYSVQMPFWASGFESLLHVQHS